MKIIIPFLRTRENVERWIDHVELPKEFQTKEVKLLSIFLADATCETWKGVRGQRPEQLYDNEGDPSSSIENKGTDDEDGDIL